MIALRTILAFGVAAGLLTLTASVSAQPDSVSREAATPTPAYAFGTDPIKLGNGFSLTLTGIGLSLFGGKQMAVSLSRTTGRVVEVHTWAFSLPPSRLQVRTDYGGASVATGTRMGPYGTISLRATKLGPLAPARPCGDPAWRRSATYVGTFRFDSRSPFGGVTRRSLRGWIGAPSCAAGFRLNVCAPHDRFYAWSSTGTLEAERWPDRVRFARFTLRDTSAAKPAQVNHQLTLLNPPPQAISVSGDLGSGRVDLAAGAPRLKGSLAFTTTSPTNTTAISCNKKKVPSRSGTTSGTVTASFMHFGEQALTDPSGQVARYP